MARRDERTCDEKIKLSEELTLEEPTEAALEAAARLVGKTWYPDEPAAWQGACEKVELAHHLEHATYVRAAMLNGSFAGIIAAAPTGAHEVQAAADVSTLWYRDHLRKVAPWTIGTSDEAAIGAFLAPVTAEMVLTQEFLKKRDARSAWEITLLAIDPACQGHGIGKALLTDVVAYLQSQEAAGFFLATDDGCDFGFYDHLGLERIAARETPIAAEGLGEQPFHVYLYGSLLGDPCDVR